MASLIVAQSQRLAMSSRRRCRATITVADSDLSPPSSEGIRLVVPRSSIHRRPPVPGPVTVPAHHGRRDYVPCRMPSACHPSINGLVVRGLPTLNQETKDIRAAYANPRRRTPWSEVRIESEFISQTSPVSQSVALVLTTNADS